MYTMCHFPWWTYSPGDVADLGLGRDAPAGPPQSQEEPAPAQAATAAPWGSFGGLREERQSPAGADSPGRPLS